MPDPPVTLSVLTGALAAFHRDVLLPDMQRIVEEAVGASERRLMGPIDGLAHKLVKFEEETRVGLARIEARLDDVEERLERLEGRMDGVEGRLTVLDRQYADLLSSHHRLEERLKRVEAKVDRAATAQETLALKSDLATLAVRVDALAEEVRRLDQRLAAS